VHGRGSFFPVSEALSSGGGKKCLKFPFDGAQYDELLNGERAKKSNANTLGVFQHQLEKHLGMRERDFHLWPSPPDQLSPASFPITNRGETFLLFSASAEATSNLCSYM
jgi:hypothetical protein